MTWPPEFFALMEGTGCPMCQSSMHEDTGYGVRFLHGRVSDAYLQRAVVQRGYTVVIWSGRHVVEPTQLSEDEASAYWADVLDAAKAIERRFEPLKMNYQTLGNALPHLHTHLIPRYADDEHPGAPMPFPAPGAAGLYPEEEVQAAVRALSRLAEGPTPTP